MFVERATATSKNPLSHSRVALTQREREVLEMLVEGRFNKEIAWPLGIEERTVKAHLSKLRRKVQVRNRVVLSTYAIAHPLVSSANPISRGFHQLEGRLHSLAIFGGCCNVCITTQYCSVFACNALNCSAVACGARRSKMTRMP